MGANFEVIGGERNKVAVVRIKHDVRPEVGEFDEVLLP